MRILTLFLVQRDLTLVLVHHKIHVIIQGTNGQLFLKLGYDCNPLDAPMVAAPAGKRWQCAWANREQAGFWYTVDADEPTNVPAVQNNTPQTTKVLKEGQIYIQQDAQVYTVQGQA